MRTQIVTFTLAAAVVVASSAARAEDPTTADCLRASETSLALRGEHKLRDARQQVLICAAQTCPADVRNECARRAQDINDAMPTVVFEAVDEHGNDLVAVRITMDGSVLADRLVGTAISIDPGEHAFVFEAEGKPKVEKRIVVREGEKNRLERVTIAPAASSAPAPAASPAPAPVRARGSAPALAPEQHDGISRKAIAWITGGVGIAGLATGGVLGLMASSKWSQAQSDCGTGCAPGSAARAEKDDAASLGTASTIAFVAGAALVAAGVVLFATDTAAKQTGLRVAPAVAQGAGGIALGGDF